MDFLQDQIPLLNHLTTLLPPSLLSTLLTLSRTTFSIITTLRAALTPLLTRFAAHPDWQTAAVLIVLAIVSLKILGMAYRAVVFWVSLVLRVGTWVSVGVVCWWIYNRGVDGFVEDVQGLGEWWVGEYRRYEGEVVREKGRMEARAGKGRRGWR
ncbi:hypothetical protein M011DRAFT_495006 [Sporormia fimetaria CBS 119925]|uniref:Nuclear pore assembly and biogenesis-domain-containing protein n=1 Tax=Sporormia fimetaria CBS 119925 TaxID=1340428 RepID=A0A6A6V9W8_9PLEO|nr:hypothetical protein M011DRAFT_495006 [Sporormia fimetaria CBS 119925]